jgi:hypothetical protein
MNINITRPIVRLARQGPNSSKDSDNHKRNSQSNFMGAFEFEIFIFQAFFATFLFTNFLSCHISDLSPLESIK